MSHSLRVKIKGLQYKGIITDKDCDRLCKALDNEDVLDKIREEIEQLTIVEGGDDYTRKMAELLSLKMKVLQIINKYKAESEEETNRLQVGDFQGGGRRKDEWGEEFFDGICPYTDKPCDEWFCYDCKVEKKEERQLYDEEDESEDRNEDARRF